MEENTTNAEILTFKDNYVVTKSDDLIMNASYELSVEEQKIVLLLISKVQPTDTQFKGYILKVTDYMNIKQSNSNKTYADMGKAIEKLMKRVIYIYKDGDVDPIICHWIDSAQLKRTSGEFQIRLNDELKEFLLGLMPKSEIETKTNIEKSSDSTVNENTKKSDKENASTKQKKSSHTSYKYNITNVFQSKYSYRIYEMLKCNEFKRKFSLSLSEFRKILLIKGNAYENYGNINNRILKICSKEINDKTDVSFTVKPLKDGKKVTGLIFNIESKKAKSKKE